MTASSTMTPPPTPRRNGNNIWTCISMLVAFCIGSILTERGALSSFYEVATTTLQSKSSLSLKNSNEKDDDNDSKLLSSMMTSTEKAPYIRKWGCDRMETPLLFIHIGKAGGGGVRARLAASSLGYTKGDQWQESDNSYYPLTGDEKARYCHGCPYRLHAVILEKSFEKLVRCNAETPFGQAIGCPAPESSILRDFPHGECLPDKNTCHMVTSGHVSIGDELSWLPPKYLRRWWKQWTTKLMTNASHNATSDCSSSSNQNTDCMSIIAAQSISLDSNRTDIMTQYFKSIQPQEIWCDKYRMQRPRPFRKSDYGGQLYKFCNRKIQQEVDALADSIFFNPSVRDNKSSGIIGVKDWSPVYASMPVLRVTMLREPFSWLMSKYAWHHHSLFRPSDPPSTIPPVICDDVKLATHNITSSGTDKFFEEIEKVSPGFARRMPLEHLLKLCGSDCRSRYYFGRITLEEIEQQVTNNLRTSFAVVGLLEEESLFFEMVSARVGYMDTTLNPEVLGQHHPSPKGRRYQRCRNLYSKPSFQLKMLKASPELAVLWRVYRVAKEVNRDQLRDLRSCSKIPLGRGF